VTEDEIAAVLAVISARAQGATKPPSGPDARTGVSAWRRASRREGVETDLR